jgi:hypothetical protein
MGDQRLKLSVRRHLIGNRAAVASGERGVSLLEHARDKKTLLRESDMYTCHQTASRFDYRLQVFIQGCDELRAQYRDHDQRDEREYYRS